MSVEMIFIRQPTRTWLMTVIKIGWTLATKLRIRFSPLSVLALHMLLFQPWEGVLVVVQAHPGAGAGGSGAGGCDRRTVRR